MNREKVAEIIPLGMRIDKPFHYLIPPHLSKSADIGKRVEIFFRNKKRVGLICSFVSETEIKNLKEIEGIIDPFPILPPEVLRLVDWVSKYYICSRGMVFKHIIPTRASRKKMFFLNESNLDYLEEKTKEESAPGEIDQDKDHFHKPFLFHYHSYKLRNRYYHFCVRKMIQQGKQVLILIPDQFSCPDLKKSLKEEYGNMIGIFDKPVNQTQKYVRFHSVWSSQLKIIIGNRSNVFLPFRNLGLIIVEQENSLLYKEERMPRYHAREVALRRSRLGGSKIILGSFAPSIESYYQSLNQKYLIKTEKYKSDIPAGSDRIQVIDMEKEKSFQRIISFRLQQQIIHCLRKKDKIVLFLNRRGFSGYMICAECGHLMKCPHCDYPVSYHIDRDKKRIVCHVCGEKIEIQPICPICRKSKIKPLGLGTQHVEVMIGRMFPKAMIQRLDADIAPNKNSQKKIINAFNHGKIDILIGTQMIFQQLKFEHIGLVGFILMDHLLNIPDYRSAELSFQFISRLALHLPQTERQKLFIQTYQPDHHSLQAMKQLDYPLFYQEEIAIREELEYPPYTKIIKINFLGEKKEKVKKSAFGFIDYAHQLASAGKYKSGIQLSKDNLMIVKEKNQYKASCLLKLHTEKGRIKQYKESLLKYILKYQSNEVKLMIDVEPIKMV